MKQIAWYDPTNGMVSTDKDSPLFTPLGQVWPLYLPSTWVGLTNEELTDLFYNTNLGQQSAVGQAIELLRERNT